MKWLVDPYNKPTVAGTVFSGLESILKLVNTVQGMGDKSETRAQNKALKPLEAARLIRGDTQEVPVSAENAADFEKAFKTSWPKTTEEGRTKKMGSLADQISSQIPTTQDAQGRKLTSPTQAQQLGTPAYDKGVAELPAVGSPQSLPAKQPKSLDEYVLRQLQGGGQGGGADQAIGLYNSLKHPGAAATADYRGKMLGLKEKEIGLKQTPAERQADKMAIEDRRDTRADKRADKPVRAGKTTAAEQRQGSFQEWKKANPDGTWLDFTTAEQKAKQAGRTDPTSIVTKTTTSGDILYPTKTTTKERKDAQTSPTPAGKDIIAPTAEDVPPNNRRKAADGTIWQNINGVISKVE